jgi:acetoacetyl-CoA synthetase
LRQHHWGAIWSSCSPEFGALAVRDRFSQIEPKVLLTVDGYRYGGKRFDILGKSEHSRKPADAAASSIGSLPRSACPKASSMGMVGSCWSILKRIDCTMI